MARNDTQAEIVKSAVDKMGEVDPMAIIIMAAAGTAGLAGQVGPLTRILNTIGNGTGVDNLSAGVFSFTGPGILYNFMSILVPSQGGAAVSGSEQNEAAQRIGYAAMNVVEAGLLYTLVKNDEVLRAGIDAAKTVIGNVTKIPVAVPV